MTEEISFVPYEIAQKIIGNVVEEEHLHEPNRRILTVYDLKGKEICWFDAEDVIAEIVKEGTLTKKTDRESDELKIAAVNYVMRHIPEWALDQDD